jgi:hypothetical protein
VFTQDGVKSRKVLFQASRCGKSERVSEQASPPYSGIETATSSSTL